MIQNIERFVQRIRMVSQQIIQDQASALEKRRDEALQHASLLAMESTEIIRNQHPDDSVSVEGAPRKDSIYDEGNEGTSQLLRKDD